MFPPGMETSLVLFQLRGEAHSTTGPMPGNYVRHIWLSNIPLQTKSKLSCQLIRIFCESAPRGQQTETVSNVVPLSLRHT